jgi:prepilin-type N-terminal cleavage/methylation domain-containing protein
MKTHLDRYRGRARPRGTRGTAAFTLIEMLAVITVIGIMFGVAVVGFNQFGRGVRLRSAARVIGQQLDLARMRALTARDMYGVEFNPRVEPDRDRLRVYYEDPPGTKITVGKWIELPPGIEFGSNAQPPVNMPPIEIEFRPTGLAVQSAGTFSFKIHDRESGKERVIEVVPLTGHTKVYAP